MELVILNITFIEGILSGFLGKIFRNCDDNTVINNILKPKAE